MPHNTDQQNKYYDFHHFKATRHRLSYLYQLHFSQKLWFSKGTIRISCWLNQSQIQKNILIRKKFRNEIPMILNENPRIYSKSSRIIRIKSVLNSYCCPNWLKWTPTNCIRCSVNGSYVGSRTLSRVPELVMLFRSFYLNIIYSAN